MLLLLELKVKGRPPSAVGLIFVGSLFRRLRDLIPFPEDEAFTTLMPAYIVANELSRALLEGSEPIIP